MRENHAEGESEARSRMYGHFLLLGAAGEGLNKEQTPQLNKRDGCVKYYMNDISNKSMVLVLNRNWQAVNVRTPQEAFCMMATKVGTGLEIEVENHIRPVTWDERITI